MWVNLFWNENAYFRSNMAGSRAPNLWGHPELLWTVHHYWRTDLTKIWTFNFPSYHFYFLGVPIDTTYLSIGKNNGQRSSHWGTNMGYISCHFLCVFVLNSPNDPRLWWSFSWLPQNKFPWIFRIYHLLQPTQRRWEFFRRRRMQAGYACGGESLSSADECQVEIERNNIQ